MTPPQEASITPNSAVSPPVGPRAAPYPSFERFRGLPLLHGSVVMCPTPASFPGPCPRRDTVRPFPPLSAQHRGGPACSRWSLRTCQVNTQINETKASHPEGPGVRSHSRPDVQMPWSLQGRASRPMPRAGPRAPAGWFTGARVRALGLPRPRGGQEPPSTATAVRALAPGLGPGRESDPSSGVKHKT